jgi:hypothetical protein
MIASKHKIPLTEKLNLGRVCEGRLVPARSVTKPRGQGRALHLRLRRRYSPNEPNREPAAVAALRRTPAKSPPTRWPARAKTRLRPTSSKSE